MPIQLPNDVKEKGYKQTSPFHWEQVFYSEKHDFEGTEKEFVNAGLGYEYIQIDKYTRLETI